MDPRESAVVVDLDAAKSSRGSSQTSQQKNQNPMASGSASWGVGPTPFIYAVHLVGIVAAILVLVWTIHNRGGLAWSSSNKNLIFNIHPVLMVIGFIFVSSEAILIYKSVPGSKQYRKAIHLSLQAIALVLACFGISAAIKYHNASNIDNFYSLHSWLGIATVVLFFFQWLVGFITFWYPGGAPSTRASVLPWHVFFGAFVYLLAVATAQTGILEKVTFLQSSNAFGHYDSEAYLANFLGIAVVLLAIFTILGAIIPLPSPRRNEDEYRALN